MFIAERSCLSASSPTKGEWAIQLHDEQRLSNKQIAAAFGMKASSVRRLISEARPALQSAGGEVPERPPEGSSLPTTSYGRQGATGGVPPPLSSTTPVTHILIPDTQCKPGVPLIHLRWAGLYIKERQPDVVILIGDHWDMESLSEYDRGKKSFEGRRYKADIEAGNHGLDLLMEGINQCKKKPRLVFTMGNHEQRIGRALELEPRLEGVLGYHDFNLEQHGWEVYDFLKPVEVDSITYSHYFYNQMSGRPYSGTIENIIKNVGHSFSQGHQQGLRWGRRELGNGAVQIGLIAGSFYQHDEIYKGPQGNHHWRGIVVKHEVHDGSYDPMMVSLGFLKRRFG